MAGNGLFGDVQGGIRTPDTVMNSGPLPPLNMGGMPYGLDGTPDARINYNSSLLGEIDPYAYGEPGRLSTQSSYINIPNRVQKVVPKIWIPGVSETDDNALLTHAVDDGDVCFVIRDKFMKCVEDKKEMDKMYTHRNYHPFVNLATVNYLLAGLQLYYSNPNSLPASWHRMATSVGFECGKKIDIQKQIERLLEESITPFGIAHGSEKQGGNHEGTNDPVTWASNFVTTMYIDGFVRNLANLWRHCDVSAGQHLVLQMRQVPLPATYTLNHYHKAVVRKSFTADQRAKVPKVWQLIPDVTHSQTFSLTEPYWRIAMSYVQNKRFVDTEHGDCFHDDSALLHGALLEASFQPVFTTLLVCRGSGPASGTGTGVKKTRFTGNSKLGGESDKTRSTTHTGAQMPPVPRLAAREPAATSSLNFKRYALAVFERPSAVPAAQVVAAGADKGVAAEADKGLAAAPVSEAGAPAGKEAAAPRKQGKKRLQGSVLGTNAGTAVTLADVI